ncbi:MBL fold metallo-hydrolase [Lyngbya confervoides]|uniref:MBL fold metallo-hydrolase n=1 Tax=Lyngbya confervoides BDU141951 TaxID=1574623 RepID=A0ABD4T0S6_9CYAN|nr:MBL fold metallo-hydrolase [Lyngbya confervoides]MCM1982205.1 MBL fold metallo-hydrolase [Lyngbya confervoides BDU141951]
MELTWYGSNSWLIEMAGQRILLDPWLVGPLVFGKQSWFFKAEHAQPPQIPEQIDAILLSQGLPDHAHPETLAVLDRSIPIIASENGAKVAEKFEYQQITPLSPGQSTQLGSLQLQAFPGAPIGPLLTENAYLLQDLDQGLSLYYEPHGFHSPEVRAQAPVDVTLVPIIDLTLPLLGPFIRGGEAALELVDWLQPQLVIPTTVGGEISYSGWLDSLLSSQGDLESFRRQLHQRHPQTQVSDPLPVGQPYSVPLRTLEPSG